MLTDEDLRAMEALLTRVLEAYGLKKPPSAAALRMQRYRERHRNEGVTGRHEGVTPRPTKRNATVTKRNEGVTDESPISITVMLNDGSEFGVTESTVKEFETLYPAVDVPQTLREIKGWCLANQGKRKTRTGVMRFINGWMAREQNKG
jgi:hypothetical protein